MMEPKVELYNEDCIAGMEQRLADSSVHLIVTSIPFEELFTYSGKPEDVGNNGSTVDIRAGRFALNMRFMVEQAFRVLAPGCNFCCHIQQLLAYRVQHGFMGRRDFRGSMVDVFGAGGFEFAGEFVIPKNPQTMAQRLNLHSLQFKTGYARSGCLLAPAVNDYVLIFHKPGQHPNPPKPLKHRTNRTGWMETDEWVRDAGGIWTDVLEIDVIDGARNHKEDKHERHVCLAKGSLVVTRDGHKPIELVEVGELVLTHKGRWRPVVAKQCNGIRKVIQTEAQGVGHLITTPDHRLFARSCLGRGGKGWVPGGNSPYRHRRNAETAVPEWMQAKDSLGSYLHLPLPPIEDSSLSANDWWLVGRWLGDGHMDARGHAHISCAHEEAEELIGTMGRHAGFAAVRRTATQVALKDRDGRGPGPIMRLLKKCGHGAANKRLPGHALCLDQEKSEALLSGYLSADGHYVERHDRWMASSVSRALLLGMAMVAQRARGVVASVYAGRPPRTCVIEGRTVKTKQDWVLLVSPRNLSGLMLDDGAWKKVRKIQNAGECEVWDIRVADDESFVAEGCSVHNCPLQLSVIQRCINLYTNPISIDPTTTVLDPFMGIGSTAFVAVGGISPVTKAALDEPRNVIGFELKESYHRASFDYVARAMRQRKQADVTLFDALETTEASQ